MNNYIKYITLFSIPINFVWEMAQMPFYSNMPWNLKTSIICLVASIEDAAMILIIYFLISFLIKDIYWILQLNFKTILFSLIVGFVISVLVERVAITNNLWTYSNSMPMMPYWKIGVSPILQMLILPLIVFKITQNKIIKLLGS